MDISGLTTIRSVVDDVLMEIGMDESYKLTMMRFAERGITKFAGLHLEDTKLVLLEINPETLTATLPGDYLKFSRLGVFINNQLVELSSNSRLKVDRTANCGEIPDNSKEEFFVNVSFGNGNHGQYGYRGGKSRYGDYTINTKAWNIQFDQFRDDVYLEYVTTGVNQNGETYIMEDMREPLIAWCKWKWAEGQNMPYNKASDYERKYYDEVAEFRKKHQTLTLQEYKDAIYQSLSNTLKR